MRYRSGLPLSPRSSPEASQAAPEAWDLRLIGQFMATFGILSSVFDTLTFLALRLMFDAGPALFRRARFAESVQRESIKFVIQFPELPGFFKCIRVRAYKCEAEDVQIWFHRIKALLAAKQSHAT